MSILRPLRKVWCQLNECFTTSLSIYLAGTICRCIYHNHRNMLRTNTFTIRHVFTYQLHKILCTFSLRRMRSLLITILNCPFDFTEHFHFFLVLKWNQVPKAYVSSKRNYNDLYKQTQMCHIVTMKFIQKLITSINWIP